MASSPIADLSYRNYDGPLNPPVNRWWAIAKMSMRLSIKKKGFWIWSVLTGAWYAILMTIFYFVDALASNAPTAINQQNPILKNIIWKDQFLNAFGVSQLFFLILALLLGAGTIANDNRANALLVYLSKPCSKLDYVIGKWLGIFVPLTLVAAVPTLLFYVNCLLGYRSYGFVSQDPWLIVRLLGMILIPGFFHASLTLGISSLFQQGRMAGATYAGLYFFTYFFSQAMQGIYQANAGSGSPETVLNSLTYCSINGIQLAVAKIFLHTDGSQLIPAPQNNPISQIQPEPSWLIFLPIYFGICGLAMLIAWSRIRAVEVVG